MRRNPRGNMGKKVVRVEDPKKIIKRLWIYLGKEKKALVGVLILIVITTVAMLVSPYMIAIAIDKYILAGDIVGMMPLLAVLGLIQIGSEGLNWLRAYMMIGISQNTVAELRREVFEKIQTLPISYFDKNKKGDLMARVTSDIENISNTLNQTITELLRSVLGIGGALILMFALNWQLTIVVLLSVPLIMFVAKNLAKFTRKYFGSFMASRGSVNGIVEEDISGIKTIKSYGQEKARFEAFEKANRDMASHSFKAQMVSGLMGPSMNMVNNIRFTMVVAFGAWFNLMGIASIGIITSFINYSRQFGRPIAGLAQLYNNIQSALAGAERVFDVLDKESEYLDSGVELDRVEGNISFDNVRFSYEKGKEILKGISFDAKKGESIALVGPTGAGKTTIINLISRFYEIESGSIIIDERDIKTIGKNTLRKRLGVVLQDTYLFSGSVRENIRFGRLNATDTEVEEVCKMANAHDFIERLPEGYDTLLSEDGGNLSEGQRQLLAIARAILADHDILILDEATSSVDTRTEKKIQDALLKLMDGKTSFVIAHRLSTIREADKILYIDNGRIAESGNHNELLELEGKYKELYLSQFGNRA